MTLDLAGYKYIVFDCDGVILDSNQIKTDAFTYALSSYKKSEVNKLISYHKKNGGVSRYRKFNYFFKNILGMVEYQKNLDLSLNLFSNYAKKSLISCEFIPGVLDFIKVCSKKKIKTFIVSGSDQNELKEIFKQRNLSRYFSLILGSPQDKFENTKKVKNRFNSIDKGIFFGDAMLDYEAAKKFDMDFIYIYGKSDTDIRNDVKKGNAVENFKKILIK